MLKQQISRFLSLFDFLSSREKLGGGKIYHFLGFLSNAVFHGASADDYFRYRLWEKSGFEKSKFITYARSKSIIKKYNSKEKVKIFKEKKLFNDFFNDYICRDWVCTDTCTKVDFAIFAKKYNKVICKPLEGGQGKGIFLYEYKDDSDAYAVFKKTHSYIIEELIIQHPLLASINPTSVNTIRVVTFTYKGIAHIISCALRTGVKGAVVDNLHSNSSQCWAIDIESGIVSTPSCGYDYQHKLIHMGSGVQVLGMKMPNWENVKALVVAAAERIPEVGYVGWDVAISEDKICLIEGNHDPGHDLMQMMDQVGKYKRIQQIIKTY